MWPHGGTRIRVKKKRGLVVVTECVCTISVASWWYQNTCEKEAWPRGGNRMRVYNKRGLMVVPEYDPTDTCELIYRLRTRLGVTLTGH